MTTSIRPGSVRVIAFLGFLVVGIGLALRILVFADNRAFWMDEAMVAISLRTRNLLEVMGTLDHGQTMPAPLALAAKLSASLLGEHEWAYRFPVLLAALALPIFIWRKFPDLIGSGPALIMLCLAAVYRPLLYYAVELKQYGVDALVTAVLVAMTLRFLSGPAGRVSWRSLVLLGAGALVASQPAVLVLAGIFCALLADPRTRLDREWRAGLFRATLIWTCVFLVLYFTVYRQVGSDPFMQKFWADSFLTPGAGWPRRLMDAWWAIVGVEDFPGIRVRLMTLIVGIGWLGTWRRRGIPVTVLMATPLIALLGAALIGVYPIAPRLVLFMAPLLFWAIAEAIDTAARFAGPARPVVAVALSAMVLIPAGIKSARFAMDPPEIEPARELAALVDPAAPVLIPLGGYYGWIWYTGDWTNPQAILATTKRYHQCLTATERSAGCDELTFAFRSPTRTLLIAFSPELNDSASTREWMDRQARRLIGATRPNSSIFIATYWEVERTHRLIEGLVEQLTQLGASVAAPDSLGLSLLYRVTLP